MQHEFNLNLVAFTECGWPVGQHQAEIQSDLVVNESEAEHIEDAAEVAAPAAEQPVLG